MCKVGCCNMLLTTYDQVGQLKRKEAEEARKKEAEEEEDFGTFDSWDFGISFGKKGPEIVSRSEQKSKIKNKIPFPQEVQCTLSAPSLRRLAMVVSLQSPSV